MHVLYSVPDEGYQIAQFGDECIWEPLFYNFYLCKHADGISHEIGSRRTLDGTKTYGLSNEEELSSKTYGSNSEDITKDFRRHLEV